MRVRKTAGRVNQWKHATDVFSNRKSIMRMLSDTFHGSYRMSLLTSMVLLLGLAYIVLPFDFDWIPFLGWIDDGFVGYWIIKRLIAEAKRYSRLKNKYRADEQTTDRYVNTGNEPL